MWRPFTNDFPAAFLAAQVGVACATTAIVVPRLPVLRWRAALFLAVVWALALLPVETTTSSAAIAALGALVFLPTKTRLTPLVGIVGLLCLALSELALGEHANHETRVAASVFVVLVYVVAHPFTRDDPGDPEASSGRFFHVLDLVLATAAVTVAALVATRLLGKFPNSGDEWAYRYQADLFAHGQAYGAVPPCHDSLRTYWIFEHDGRTFSQYTPGWPFVLAIFARIGFVWLAGPVGLGALVLGVARLTRRIVRARPNATRAQLVSATVIASVGVTIAPSMLLNAASFFPHTMITALFVWIVECTCSLAERPSRGIAIRSALVFGFSAALAIASRPPDGVLVSAGSALWLFSLVVRKRVPVSHAAYAVGAFVLGIVPMLVVLRLQTGQWLTFGYAFGPEWARANVELRMPKASEVRFGVALGELAYMWWPCVPALGIAGLVHARGEGRRVATLLGVGSVLLVVFYVFVRGTAGPQNQYGPRYILPAIASMPVGLGVLGAQLLHQRWLVFGRALFATTIASTMLILGPKIYPVVREEIATRTAMFTLVRERELKQVGLLMRDPGMDPLDMTRNYPSVKNPRVLYALPGDEMCLSRHYPGRTWYLVDFRSSQPLFPFELPKEEPGVP